MALHYGKTICNETIVSPLVEPLKVSTYLLGCLVASHRCANQQRCLQEKKVYGVLRDAIRCVRAWLLLAQHVLLQPPVSLQTHIQQKEKGNKQAEQQFVPSAKAGRCAFRRVAPPGIHHLRLAVNRQLHWSSYYTLISFHTDCEYKQKNYANWKLQFVASAKARRRAFRCVALPGIHHLRLAVNRQPHRPSYYTPIPFHTDSEPNQKNYTNWKLRFVASAKARRRAFQHVAQPGIHHLRFSIRTRYLAIHPPKAVYNLPGG